MRGYYPISSEAYSDFPGLTGLPASTLCPLSLFPKESVSGSTVNSPVQVTATAHITGTLSHIEVWVDGAKKYTETTSLTLNTAIPVPSGKNHKFAVFAVNTAGTKWKSVVYATVP